MMYRSKHSRRIRNLRPFPLQQAVEILEQRMLLSIATITNDPTQAPIDGAVTVSVDSYGSFGENIPQSGALYTPFTNGTIGNSVEGSALYFQPAGQFLTEQNNTFGTTPLTSNDFSSQSVSSVTSSFSIDGFNITLTQTVEPVPSGDGTTQLVQEYSIQNISNGTYNNVPFTVVRYLQSDMQWTFNNKDWAGLSGDNRIAISFDTLATDSVFERIDVSGLDSSNNQVADWQLPTGIAPNGATTSRDNQYFNTIIANQGITNNGIVAGDTNGDLLDDTAVSFTNIPNYAVLALSDSITTTMGGPAVTYITTTGWGDTGTVQPVDYRKPGTWDISAFTPVAPEGTNATVEIFRTNGTFGHSSVTMNNIFPNTATPGEPGDPNADFQQILDGDSPPNPLVLPDGAAATLASFPIFDDIKIEGAENITVEINNPTFGAILKNAAPTITSTDITIPASDQPSPFHFSTTDPATGDTAPTTFTEGQTGIQIPVVRNSDDGATPTNTGPYGNFSVQYTITGSGSNPATPGELIKGVPTPSNADFVDNTPGTSFDATTNTITGSLSFTSAVSPTQAATMVLGMDYQYINLQMLTDHLYEGPETFTITLQSSDSLLITTPSTFVGTIDDTQTSGPVHLQFANESVDQAAGSKTIGVIRSLVAGADNGQVTMNYTVTGGSASDQAQPGVDFTVPGATLNGDSYTGSLIFDENSSSPETSIVIDLIATKLAEPSKTLTITLSDPNNIVGLLGQPNTETLTITNNNTPGEIYFLGTPTQTITEGPDPTTGALYKTLTLQVTRDPADGSQGAVSVNYTTVDGTAFAGTDYDSSSGTLTWADGQTGPQNITVKVLDDTVDPYPRTNKSFSVNLTSPTGGAVLGTPSSVVVTIIDNQQPGINLSDSNYTAYEKDPSTGQPGTVNVIVDRNLAAGQSVTAPWSFTYAVIPGTAQPNVDYVPPTLTTINVPGSDATYTLQIPLLADPNSIADTHFTVRLTSATIGSASSLGSSTGATVTILNADASVQLAASIYSANPGSGFVPIVITRTSTEQSDVPIIVSYATADGSAIAGKDYTATTGSITIPADQTSVTVNVPILTPINASQATRSFSFKITSAVLADPTDDANSVTLHFNSTPATINIAGLVNVTSIQLLPGWANRIAEVVVTFSDPVNSADANNKTNYILTTIGRRGAFNSQVFFTNAQYNPANQSVSLFLRTPLTLNKLYQLSIRPTGIHSTSGQPFITGVPGGLGGTAIATFARGSRVQYTDPDGDIVTLQMKRGGSMDFIDGLNGGNPNLIITGNSRSQLTGSLKARGDGHALIDSVTNPDGVQDLLLINPLFSVENV